MKKLIPIIILVLMLCSCSKTYYQSSMIHSFDTVITLTAPASSEQEFDALFSRTEELVQSYHRFYDAYNRYEGITNIASLNDTAHLQPVKVEPQLLDLIIKSKQLYDDTEGGLNIALGAVTELWLQARKDGVLPDEQELKAASEHCDIEDIIIDEQNSTVFIADSNLRLDVGGIAKGYAAEMVIQTLKSEGYDNLLLSMGGNVVALGDKDGEGWVVGIENPNPEISEIVEKVVLPDGYSLVVSGDYLRSYTVDGVTYGHIIDPTTLYPPTYYSSVAILAEHSDIADAFSTALFTITPDDALTLAEKNGVEAMLILKDLQTEKTANFKDFFAEKGS